MAAAATLLACTNAHMVMKTPKPFPGNTDNSPLLENGSNFPCKLNGNYDAKGVSNAMAIGASQTLSFTGSAVHGGGSCQISLTKDLAPTKDSQWQVIHSIEGGCPSTASGNLPEDPNGGGAGTFQFSIPEGIEPAEYVLAWTWFNKIGNREMYMNCAPVTVTGPDGSSKRDTKAVEQPGFSKRAPSFPPMFVANIASVDCKTEEGKDLLFPSPGDSVQLAGSDESKYGPPVGNCGASAPSAAGGSSSGGSSPASSVASTPQPSNTGGIFAQGSTGTGTPTGIAASSPVIATPVASPAPSAAAPNVSSGSSNNGSSSPSTTSAGALTGACTPEGEWNCVGGNSFQQCASGAWSVLQPMAQGTSCSPGQGQSLTMGAKGRRSTRLSRSHMRRHRVRVLESANL